MRKSLFRCGTAVLMAWAMGASAGIAAGAQPGSLTVKVDQPGVKISPMLYGLMTEEINHSYDGGLYGELIQNRAFHDVAPPPPQGRGARGTVASFVPAHWSVVGGEAAGTAVIDFNDPVNKTALKNSLRLDILNAQPGQRVGVANGGYWGIPVKPDTEYRASFYARSGNGFNGPLTVEIESADGGAIHARATVAAIGPEWKKYTVALKTGDVKPSTANRFVISGSTKGTVWLSLVSLFPPTYNNRPNGNRIDLMQKLIDMHPAFLRFPGGNYLEGNEVSERFNWKETVGPIEERPGHQCPWGYWSTDGFGLLEFLNWCEDVKMEPVLAVYAGYSLRGVHVTPGPQLEPFVQEDLDEIEYVIGDTHTRWGAQRAKDGHPAPFKLTYVEVGNEDGFDASGAYDARFAQIYDAIKARYPQLQVIATAPIRSRKPDVIDDHYYRSAKAMENDVHHYDKSDRNGPKIFVGEWATTEGSPTPTMQATLGDAAWLTGMERNSDLIVMSCYAPLLVNVNPGAAQWGTNLIGYDALTSFGSPSYYVQKMFNQNRGDTVIPVDLSPQTTEKSAEPPPPHGAIGLGTWATDSEYKDLKVTKGDQVLFQSDLAQGTTGWNIVNGDWKVDQDAGARVLHQTSNNTDCRIWTGDPGWSDYTFTLKARKLGGNEGFLVLFNVQNKDNYMWWNIGGWTNTRTAVEAAENGSKRVVDPAREGFGVESNRWYDLKLVLSGNHFMGYVDGQLVTDVTYKPEEPPAPMYATASREASTGDVIVKCVNVSGNPQQLEVNLQGTASIDKNGSTIEVVSGQPTDVNSVAAPEKVATKKSPLSDAAPKFVHEFPAYSVSVMRLKTR